MRRSTWQKLLVALAGLLFVLGGCNGDEQCGAISASTTMTAQISDDTTVVLEDFRSSPNNDCGEPDGPVSLTLEATQQGTSRLLVLCLPRPDRLDETPVSVDDASRVRIIDFFADREDGCLLRLDRSTAATGTAAFPGICRDGLHQDGYDVVLDLQLPVIRTCDGQSDEALQAVVSGTAAVRAENL